MELKNKWLLFGWLVFFTVNSDGEARHQPDITGALPKLMREHVAKINCAAIQDFYSNYMVTDPPYVWLNSNSFALVCERQNAASVPKYELIIKADKGKHSFASCPANVSLAAKPGGLSLEKRKILAGNFTKLGNNESLESTSDNELPVLSLSTGGGGYIEYICIGSDWYVNTYS